MVNRKQIGLSDAEKIVAALVEATKQAGAANTRPAGNKVLDEGEDVSWTRPDGTGVSVREVDTHVEETRQSLADSLVRLEAGEAAVADLRDVRLPALEEDLDELDAKTSETFSGYDARVETLTSDLAGAQAAVTAAQQTADAAVQAASAASQAALQAAGIADSKGRVIYSETEPSVADRSSSNLWVKPSDASTRVWVPDQSKWVEVEDSDIKAAAQSAAAANTKAVEAASAAAQAKAAAATAQSTAEAAQRTADKGVLDARDAFNAAVTAQTTADQMKSDLAKGPTVWDDPSFERGSGPVGSLRSNSQGSQERVQEHATDGAWSLKLTSGGGGGTNYPGYMIQPITAGHTYMISASVFSDSGSALGIYAVFRDSSGTGIRTFLSPTIASGATAGLVIPNGSLVRNSWISTAPDNAVDLRYYIGQPTAYNQAANAGQTVYLDELRLVDITDAYPALKAAQDAAAKAQADATKAQQTADSKATPAQAQAMADAAKTAATTAASADATAKASQAKADALAAAATDAQQKADAAKASAAADAQSKADAAKAAAITAAAADAQAKADAAKAAALAAAAADAKAKADQALADAKADASTKAAAAQAAAITAAAADATAKAAAAETAAKSAAAADAKTKADQAKADAIAASGSDASAKAEAARQAAVDAARAAADAADALVEQRAAEDATAKASAAQKAAADALATARGQITSEITASANGKNAIRWSTSAPSTSTPGVVAGDTWMQVDALATRNVKGQWTWDGSAWKPVLIRSEVIAALDVSKLTAAEATIATAVIDKMFAQTFAAHKIAAGQIDAESVAAAVGTFVKVDVSQLTATTADLNDVVAQKIAGGVAQFVELSADKITGGRFTGETFTGGEFIGGEYRTSDALPGQVTLADDVFKNGPGISIEPENSQAYDWLPGMGPTGDGALISGGWGYDGQTSGVSLKYGSTSLYWNQSAVASTAGAWLQVDKVSARMSYQANRSDATVRSLIEASNGKVVQRAAASPTTFSSITSSPDGSELYVQNSDSGIVSRATADTTMARLAYRNPTESRESLILAEDSAARMSFVSPTRFAQFRADENELTMWRETRADGKLLTQDIFAFDADGLTYKQLGKNAAGTTLYNRWTKFGDSGWINVTPASSIRVGEQLAYRIVNSVCYWRGIVYGSSSSNTLAAGSTNIMTIPAVARPQAVQLRPTATNAAVHLFLQIDPDGKFTIWSSAATAGWIHINCMSYALG